MPQSMASRNHRLSVVDVYDIAASIGKEFEKIIDSHGPDSVTELMPKVINVLEHLEELTNQEQEESGELEELKFSIERLQSEKAAKAEEREKYEQELEQIEESWKSETQELMGTVTRLQEENKHLKCSVREKEGHDYQQQRDAVEEITIISQLQDTIHKNRSRMRSLEREVKQKTFDGEAMQGQVERLARLNSNMRHQSNVTQHRAQTLIQEQVDLQVKLHEKEQEILKIRDKMREQDTSPPVRLTPYVFEAQLSPKDMISLQDKLEKQGKMVYDSNDPNRPRFTTNQLRDVLHEKSDLRTKLIEVEEQLQQYKPVEKETISSPFNFDAPVYGPINKEPDEKLYPDRHTSSGIRKFFRSLLSPGGGSKRRVSRTAQQLTQVSTSLTQYNSR